MYSHDKGLEKVFVIQNRSKTEVCRKLKLVQVTKRLLSQRVAGKIYKTVSLKPSKNGLEEKILVSVFA